MPAVLLEFGSHCLLDINVPKHFDYAVFIPIF